MKKYDIIAIGELNADVILNRIEGFPEIGKEKFAKDMIITLGSSTAIFAANAASLGSEIAFAGMIGKDSFGGLVRDSLAAKGVNTSMLIEHPTVPTGATIVMNYAEDRANITYQGTMDIMSFDDIDKEIFKQTKHIHISSIFMQSGILRDLDKILACAHENGATTSLDAQWDPSETWKFDYKKILPLVSVFLPNEKELMLLTGSNSLDEAIEKVKNYISICIVKQGNKGSLLLTKEGERRFLSSFLNNNVVDAIGAGDSFNSGFITRFVKGASLHDCQLAGNLTGAINTTDAGGTAAFETKDKIREKAKQFKQEIAWL